MVVLDSIQLVCTFSFKHLLKAFTKPFLIFLFFTICFITSVFTLSVPAALPFFCLFTILVRSSSFIIGNGIILLPPFLLSSFLLLTLGYFFLHTRMSSLLQVIYDRSHFSMSLRIVSTLFQLLFSLPLPC